jgi:hypothetical protein
VKVVRKSSEPIVSFEYLGILSPTDYFLHPSDAVGVEVVPDSRTEQVASLVFEEALTYPEC